MLACQSHIFRLRQLSETSYAESARNEDDPIPDPRSPIPDPRSPIDGWWRSVVYASGNLGKSVVWTTSEIFLLLHLITLTGIAPTAAGVLLATIMVVEGLADILIGHVSSRPAQGRAPSHGLLAAALLCGVSFWLVFADLGLAGGARTTQIIVALLVCRGCYTLCDVAHNALIIRLAHSPAIGATIAGTRLMFSSLGAALVGGASAAVIRHGWGTFPATLTLFAGVGGLLYAILVPVALWAGRHAPMPTPPATRASPGASVSALLGSVSVRRLLYLVFLQAFTAPLLLKMLPFVSQTVLGDAAFPGTAVAIVAVAQGAALPCWTIAARRLDVRHLLAIGHALLVLSAVALASGISAGSSTASGIAIALFGIAQAALSVAIWSCLPVTARALDGGNGAADPLLTGLFLAALKWGSGVGTGLLGVMVAGWEHQAPFSFGVLMIDISIAMTGSVLCMLILAVGPWKPTMPAFRQANPDRKRRAFSTGNVGRERIVSHRVV